MTSAKNYWKIDQAKLMQNPALIMNGLLYGDIEPNVYYRSILGARISFHSTEVVINELDTI